MRGWPSSYGGSLQKALFGKETLERKNAVSSYSGVQVPPRASMQKMKKKKEFAIVLVVLAILPMLVGGCVKTSNISGVSDLILNEQDLQQLGMIENGECQTDNEYSNIVDSSSGQYSMCNYVIHSLNDTGVTVELQKFANHEALDGSYQYSSSHLYSIEGLISENVYGDKSRLRVNNVNDYGGQYDPPGIYFYHLWICKDLYLIHVTSGGSEEKAKDSVIEIGQLILSKFE